MNDLIKLNATEQFLQNANVTVTLKEVADRFGKKNYNLINDFNKMISTLSEDSFNGLKFQAVEYKDKKGEKRQTISMDLKTLVWFIAKFDHELRYQVVNFAFEKLEKEKQTAVTDATKKAKAPKIYRNGLTSVRGCIYKEFQDIEDDINESDVWNALVYTGLAKTKAKVTIKRVIPKQLDSIVGYNTYCLPTYKPSIVRDAYNQWIEAGKPVKSEYDRLVEEFAEISEYYREKIEKAKDKQL